MWVLFMFYYTILILWIVFGKGKLCPKKRIRFNLKNIKNRRKWRGIASW